MTPKELEALYARGNRGYLNEPEPGPLLNKIRKAGIIKGGGRPLDDEGEDSADSATIRSSVVEPEPDLLPLPLVKDFEVICINNVGIEDKFDQGVEYVAVALREVGFLTVYDKLGKKQTCMASRFKIAEEE